MLSMPSCFVAYGSVLHRFYELIKKLLICFTWEQSDSADFLIDSWCTKDSFLAVILNNIFVEKCTQGKPETFSHLQPK